MNNDPIQRPYKDVNLKRGKWVEKFHSMHGTLNRAVWINKPNPDGTFTQKLEKVKIALRKGLIKTA